MAQWITVWGQAASCMNRITPRYHNRSMRLTVPAMLSGSALRVRLSNRDGKKPLHVVEAALQHCGHLPARDFEDIERADALAREAARKAMAGQLK